jgi:O-antigen/teichoic acid export membrane protein
VSEAVAPGRRAAGQAGIYVTASVLAKGLAFGVVPLLATFLGPAEFGVWGVASAAGNLVTLVLLFGLYTPASRLYFEETDPRSRREVFFSLYVFQIAAGAAITLALDRYLVHGAEGAPHPGALRLALWAGYLTSLNLIPLSLMRVKEQARRHAAFSLLATIASWALHLSDRAIIERLSGAASAVIYTAGYSLASALMVIVEAAGNSWLTLFLRLEIQEGDRASIRRYARLFVAASAWAGLGVVLAMPLVARAALPPEYAPAERVVLVAGLGFTFLAPYLVLVYAVMSAPRFTAFPAATLASAALNVAATVFLVPRIGVVGAAVSSVIGYASLALLTAAIAQRVWPIAHDFRAWAGAILATFILGLLPLWIGRQPAPVEVAFRTALLLGGWPVLAVLLGGVRKEDLSALAPMASAIWARYRKR